MGGVLIINEKNCRTDSGVRNYLQSHNISVESCFKAVVSARPVRTGTVYKLVIGDLEKLETQLASFESQLEKIKAVFTKVANTLQDIRSDRAVFPNGRRTVGHLR